MASWYGHPYHGRPAADGEIYDMETLVAAHRTLPFQTWVRVRNLRNDKAVDVRIIDRGPFVGGRIIDLSHAAAQAIELIGPGVAEVELTILAFPANPEPARFGVQVGAFREKSNADRFLASMMQAYGQARAVLRPGDPAVWRVLAGREPSPQAAELLARRLSSLSSLLYSRPAHPPGAARAGSICGAARSARGFAPALRSLPDGHTIFAE